MKDWLKKQIKAKEEARAALKAKGKKSESVEEIRSLQEQVEAIDVEISEFRSQLEEVEKKEQEEARAKEATKEKPVDEDEEFRSEKGLPNQPLGELRTLATFGLATNQTNEQRMRMQDESEKRGKDLLEGRAVTVGSGNIVVPQHDSPDIRPTFNEVSGLIDRVSHKFLRGGESFKQPYVKGYGEGGYTEEGEDYADAETEFGYAPINKAKITAYAEDSEELQKLPAADYDAEVVKGVRIASRKLTTRQILIGTGGTNKLVGIFSSQATAIDPATDLAIGKIDNKTLDEIIFSFGGDEDVEDPAVLILNKRDLKAFAQLRSTDGKKIHTIVTNGNSGTIDGIPFIINSACKALVDENTQEDDYCMAYGPLSNYLLTIFSDVDIQRSTDYKFKQGMIAHRSSVFLGGNVVSKNGFLRVKKGEVTNP